MQAGPDLSIEFNTAEGLEVGKTQLRYKDVNVGTVRSIGFNADRSKVVVQAEPVSYTHLDVYKRQLQHNQTR